MRRLILVRHGETAWNREKVFRGRADIPLSDRGLRQAELTGRALRESKPEIIYTSPLQRSSRTAEAIAKYTGATVVAEQALTDIDFGDWSGRPQAQVKAEFPDLYALWKTAPHRCQLPNGESLSEVWKRAGDFVLAAGDRHKDNVILVTHRVVLKVLMLGLLEVGLEHFWSLRMDTCSLSAIEYTDGKASLALLNDTCHLAGETDLAATDF